MLATLLAFYLQSVLSSPLNFQQPLRFNDPLASKVSFLVLGDWGSGFKEQKTIAGIMHTVAELNQSEFIVAVGDNFYTQGVVDTNDSKFADYWKNMYTGYLANIPWYVVLGNHDWYGNPVAQIEYTKIDEKWPDHFYTQSTTVGSKLVSMIFIDSDLLYYGFETNEIDYRKTGWDENTMERQFYWIESELNIVRDSDYIFVFGHHPVNVCEMPVNMVRLAHLMDQYHISAYIFGKHLLTKGHVHNMGFSRSKSDTMYVLTGSGGQSDATVCPGDADWKIGGSRLFSFVEVKLSETQFSVDYINQNGNVFHTENGSPRKH